MLETQYNNIFYELILYNQSIYRSWGTVVKQLADIYDHLPKHVYYTEN